MFQIVLSLQVVASCQVKGSNSSLRVPAFLLYEEPTNEVAGPIEAVGAVDTDQPPLPSISHGGVEFLYHGLTGNLTPTTGSDLGVGPVLSETVSGPVVLLGVGQVDDVGEVRDIPFQGR